MLATEVPRRYAESLDGIDMPPTVRELPVCPTRGVPVPWFVRWTDGVPDFRVVAAGKREHAISMRACWVCGRSLPSDLFAFVLGPISTVSRASAEPPSHVECARFSVRACPFLVKPYMRRRADDPGPGTAPMPGFHVARNPGVCAVWACDDYRLAGRAREQRVIKVPDPLRPVEWWSAGRPATHAEVVESFVAGVEHLFDATQAAGGTAADFGDLAALVERARRFFPPPPAGWEDPDSAEE